LNLIDVLAYSSLTIRERQQGERLQELKAKWVFEQGGFSKALVAMVPMGNGYHLHLVKFGRNSESELIERQRGGWRVFKTIDAAVQTARKIGFRRVEVDLSGMRD